MLYPVDAFRISMRLLEAMRRAGPTVLLGGAVASCGGGSGGLGSTTPSTPTGLSAPATLAGDWPTATPGEVGLDTARLTTLVTGLRNGVHGRIHALLLARHGRLAIEEYFAGSGREDVHTVQSVTKSVTSLLVGIAIDEGLLRSEGERVLDVLPEYADLRGRDPRKDALTLEHLLTMRTGLLWSEEPYAGSDLERLNNSRGDWVRFVLEHAMREEAGTRWEYNSGGVIVLAGVLRSAAQVDPAAFARSRLFEPLGVRGEQWFRSSYDGLPHTGGGLSLRGRDMAKLGELVLRNGRWGERTIVSPAWLEKSAHRAAGPLSWPRPVFYGLLFWLFPPPATGGTGGDAPDIVTASGAGGQWIFVVRPLDLVVVFTADRDNARFFTPADLMFEQILPAVMG